MKKLKMLTSLLALFLSTSVMAQVAPGGSAPELKTKSAVDSYGIDLISGQALISGVNLSIGAGEGAIVISDNSFNGMRTKYNGRIEYLVSDGTDGGCELLPLGTFFAVSIGGETAVFRQITNTTYQLIRGRGSLAYVNGFMIYRNLDGAEYKYRVSDFAGVPAPGEFAEVGSHCSRGVFGQLINILKPNGEILDIDLGSNIAWNFLMSVRSSLGWMFKTDLSSRSGDRSTPAGDTLTNEYLFINQSLEYCDASLSASCAGVGQVWPRFKVTSTYKELGLADGIQSVSCNSDLINALGKKTNLSYSYTEGFPVDYDAVLITASGLQKKIQKTLQRHVLFTQY